MKKVFISIAAVAALAVAGCTSGAEKAVDNQANEVVSQIKAATSEAQASDIVTKAKAYVDELVQSGNCLLYTSDAADER